MANNFRDSSKRKSKRMSLRSKQTSASASYFAMRTLALALASATRCLACTSQSRASGLLASMLLKASPNSTSSPATRRRVVALFWRSRVKSTWARASPGESSFVDLPGGATGNAESGAIMLTSSSHALACRFQRGSTSERAHLNAARVRPTWGSRRHVRAGAPTRQRLWPKAIVRSTFESTIAHVDSLCHCLSRRRCWYCEYDAGF